MRRTWPAPHPAGLRECPNPKHREQKHWRDPELIYQAGYWLDGYWHKCRFCRPRRERTEEEFAAFVAGWLALDEMIGADMAEGAFDFWERTLWELYWDWRLPQERWDNEWGKRVH